MSVLIKVEQQRSTPWKKRILVALAVLVVVTAAGGAAGLYLYDRNQRDQIAAGVTVEGVDIGGLSTTDARATLARRLLPRYTRPLEIAKGRRRFVLLPGAVGLRIDIAGAVARALQASRRGGFLHRLSRELRGLHVSFRTTPRVRYAARQLNAFVGRVGQAVFAKPVGGRFVPSLRTPRIVPARQGLTVRKELLAQRIAGHLVRPERPRFVPLPTKVLPGKPSTTALAHRFRYYVAVSRNERRLRLFEHLRLRKTYVIAVGRIGLETPAGLYRIDDKQINPSWHVPRSPWAGSLAGRVIPPGPDDPLKGRWMGFYDGAGVHGTDDLSSLGTAASHGCIRMSIPDVIQLYNIVPLHTPIFIS
jgi:L,D-transpeptidase catalytic domain/Putative peptidoglycan binding domain